MLTLKFLAYGRWIHRIGSGFLGIMRSRYSLYIALQMIIMIFVFAMLIFTIFNHQKTENNYDMEKLGQTLSYSAQQNLAYFDSLTGIPNKISFMMTLEEMIEKSDHEKSYYYVLMIDLDNFKTHNHQDDN
ncbi:GGDEF domain-containing protein [Proteocatella sphenisci]|uniref:GGDEF domain-containing protein n=1 Tax=Proteocatella sphenisci TaxID=181070 RepID=UPI00146A9543|nr:diguanylate cyclase [Proteocatella sphenisci]